MEPSSRRASEASRDTEFQASTLDGETAPSKRGPLPSAVVVRWITGES